MYPFGTYIPKLSNWLMYWNHSTSTIDPSWAMGRIRFPRRREQTSSRLLKRNCYRQSAPPRIWATPHQQHITPTIRHICEGSRRRWRSLVVIISRRPATATAMGHGQWPRPTASTTKVKEGTLAGSIIFAPTGCSRHCQGESRLTYFGDQKVAPRSRG